MTIITRPTKTGGSTEYIAGNDGLAEEFNADANTIYDDYNGNITEANVSPSMRLPGSNLADAPAGIFASKLNDLAVTTAKIDNLAVTAAKLAAGAVTLPKIGTLQRKAFTNTVAPTTGNYDSYTAQLETEATGVNFQIRVHAMAFNLGALNVVTCAGFFNFLVTPDTPIPVATHEIISVFFENTSLGMVAGDLTGTLVILSVPKT
jgi:hypothetical protein